MAEPIGTGPGDILDHVRRSGPTTRRGIQDATGLSRVTVSQRVEALLAAGLLREGARADSTGGRRPLQLEFDLAAGTVLVAALNTDRGLVGVVDLGHRVLSCVDIAVDVTASPADTLDELMGHFEAQLTTTGSGRKDVVGIGLSVPGPVDPRTQRLNEPPIMASWDGFDIAGHIRNVLDVPVVVENDANAMAIGEHVSSHPDDDALIFCKVASGIGAGIVLHGKIWPGHDGGAGDIGHIRTGDSGGGRVCRCGATGCLAADSSGWAIASQLREDGRVADDARGVAELVRSGDARAVELVTRAGQRIGEVLASLVCVINPETVVLGGDLASPALRAAVVSAMTPRCMPRATRHLSVVLSRLGEEAALVGLGKLVVDHVYDVARLNRELSG